MTITITGDSETGGHGDQPLHRSEGVPKGHRSCSKRQTILTRPPASRRDRQRDIPSLLQTVGETLRGDESIRPSRKVLRCGGSAEFGRRNVHPSRPLGNCT